MSSSILMEFPKNKRILVNMITYSINKHLRINTININWIFVGKKSIIVFSFHNYFSSLNIFTVMSGSTDAVLDSMMADMMEGIDRIFEEASNSNTELDAIIGEERDG